MWRVKEERRRRGRPRLRWEDCVKRDVRKTGEEGDWKNKTRDRGGQEETREAKAEMGGLC